MLCFKRISQIKLIRKYAINSGCSLNLDSMHYLWKRRWIQIYFGIPKSRYVNNQRDSMRSCKKTKNAVVGRFKYMMRRNSFPKGPHHPFSVLKTQCSLLSTNMYIRRAELPQNARYCESAVPSIWQNLRNYVLKDPILAIITLAAVIGSFCLLSGLILLAMISKALNDQTSEAILLMGMGFFVLSVAYITWKLTYREHLMEFVHVVKEDSI